MISHDHNRHAQIAYWITLALVGLAMGGLLLLLPHAGSARRWTIHWLPGAGPMDVGLGETGFYAALATVGACLFALAATRAEIRPAAGMLSLLALLGGIGAFLAEHFLLRYVMLEIVALCVALAPLAEMRENADGANRGRWARLVYLVLRIGDAGLMVGILVLWSTTGTLEISPALAAGQTLPAETLGWIVGGLLLAVWVKLGSWPLHVWQQAGTQLSPYARSWLYRTLTPNLGLYLLYRITPLIAKTRLVRAGALWLGALGAAWAAALLLGASPTGRERTSYSPMVYLGAALGGLALVLAALELKTTVWLMLLVLTPLRLLLSLAGDRAQSAAQAGGRKATALLYGVSALGMVAFNVLILWWMREAGSPLAVRLVVEIAVGLIAAWAMVTTLALWRGTPAEEDRVQPPPSVRASAATRRWVALSLLAAALLAGCLWQAPLLDHLAQVSHGPPFVRPMPATAVRLLVTSPTGLIVFILALWTRRRAMRGILAANLTPSGQTPDPARALERGIRQGARAIHTTVEAGALRGTLAGITQGLVIAAQWTHRWVEGGFLEGATRQIARTAIDGGKLTHRWIEGSVLEGTTRQVARTAKDGGRRVYKVMKQGGLEGLLRRMVQAVMAGSRWLQRLHTGRLRRNLIWVAASLALAVLGLILYVW